MTLDYWTVLILVLLAVGALMSTLALLFGDQSAPWRCRLGYHEYEIVHGFLAGGNTPGVTRRRDGGAENRVYMGWDLDSHRKIATFELECKNCHSERTSFWSGGRWRG